MNMFVVDVTDIPNVKTEDEVVLLGKQAADEEITAEELAGLIGTINYEIVARVSSLLPRIIV
jgi:alanine racemase